MYTLSENHLAKFLLWSSTLPLFKNRKKCNNFGKRCPDSDHLSFKFLIYNAILKGFYEEKLEIFPCGAFLSRFVYDCLSKSPNSKKTFLPSKILSHAPVTLCLLLFILLRLVSVQHIADNFPSFKKMQVLFRLF